MKIPKKSSMTYKVLEAFLEHGPMNRMDACVYHGHFQKSNAMDIKEVYEWHVDNGNLVVSGDIYSLSKSAKKHFDDLNGVKKEADGDIVQPYIIDYLNRPEWKSNLSSSARRNDASQEAQPLRKID